MACDCNDEPVINNIIGEKGADGNNGWTPIVSSPTVLGKKVLKVTGWFGGTGTPPTSNVYVYSGGYTADSSLATDFTGPQGSTGNTGAAGNNGWTMVPSVVVDPGDTSRYVIQIVDYTGGSGTKPNITNQFIGAAGIVNTASAAVNVRGAQGAQGPAGTTLPNPSGSNGKFLGVQSNAYALLDLPSDLPAISSNTKRVLREKADGTGAEWYSSFKSFKEIPFVQNGINNSSNLYTTLTNGSVSLSAALPNDGATRNLLIIVTTSVTSNSSDGSSSSVHFAIRNTTANTTIQDNIFETAYRKGVSFQYYGSFVCSGQTIAAQWKNDMGQNTGAFLGGQLNIIELL